MPLFSATQVQMQTISCQKRSELDWSSGRLRSLSVGLLWLTKRGFSAPIAGLEAWWSVNPWCCEKKRCLWVCCINSSSRLNSLGPRKRLVLSHFSARYAKTSDAGLPKRSRADCVVAESTIAIRKVNAKWSKWGEPAILCQCPTPQLDRTQDSRVATIA